jgi:hypothetical protein
VAPDSILGFSGASGFDAVSVPGFTAYTVSITSERLAESAQILEQPEIQEPGAVRYPNPAAMKVLHDFLANLFQDAREMQIDLAKRTFVAKIDSELPLIFLQAWTESTSPRRSRVAHRLRVFRRARDYIDANTQGPITVADVCRATSCSPSTLGRAFREQFGVSPKLYLTAVRLAGVRRSLMTNETPIGE